MSNFSQNADLPAYWITELVSRTKCNLRAQNMKFSGVLCEKSCCSIVAWKELCALCVWWGPSRFEGDVMATLEIVWMFYKRFLVYSKSLVKSLWPVEPSIWSCLDKSLLLLHGITSTRLVTSVCDNLIPCSSLTSYMPQSLFYSVNGADTSLCCWNLNSVKHLSF